MSGANGVTEYTVQLADVSEDSKVNGNLQCFTDFTVTDHERHY